MRIRVIDLETTGDAPPEHAVVEIGWCDVVSQKRDLTGAPYDWAIRFSNPASMLVDPKRDVPPEISAIHHLTLDDLKGRTDWRTAANRVFTDGEVDAYAAHSMKFEKQWCTEAVAGPMPWICTYKCALRIWPDAPSHSNQALRYWRKPEHLLRTYAEPSHRAGPDAYVTAHHLRDMLNGGAHVGDLMAWSKVPALQVKCHIGQWRGKKWAEVDLGFLHWLLTKDFDEDVRYTAQHWIDQHERMEREAREGAL